MREISKHPLYDVAYDLMVNRGMTAVAVSEKLDNKVHPVTLYRWSKADNWPIKVVKETTVNWVEERDTYREDTLETGKRAMIRLKEMMGVDKMGKKLSQAEQKQMLTAIKAWEAVDNIMRRALQFSEAGGKAGVMVSTPACKVIAAVSSSE